MTFYKTQVFSASAANMGRTILLAPVSGQNVVLDSINLIFGATGTGVTGVATVWAGTGTEVNGTQMLYQLHAYDESDSASFHKPGIVSTAGSKTVPQGLVLELFGTQAGKSSYVVTCGYRDATKY